MYFYQSQKDVKKAMVVGLELANIASPDGREWFINEEIGNLLAKNGPLGRRQQSNINLR